jgi:hypothetical protein
MYFLDSYRSDVAVCRLSQLLGMDSVPPGVVPSIDAQEGIVQLWIEGLTSYGDWLAEGGFGTPPSLYLERQVTDMRVFDLLIRNTDRNRGSIVWGQGRNLWLIDHTRSLARDANVRGPDKLKGVSWGPYEAAA